MSAGWLENMVAVLAPDACIGMGGPVTNYVSGRQQLATVPLPGDHELYAFAHKGRNANRGKRAPHRPIAGFAIIMRKARYDEIGGQEQRFGSGIYKGPVSAGPAKGLLNQGGRRHIHPSLRQSHVCGK